MTDWDAEYERLEWEEARLSTRFAGYLWVLSTHPRLAEVILVMPYSLDDADGR